MTMGILGDIAKRDLSGNKKKENDINHLKMEDFKDYINMNYVLKPYWEVMAHENFMSIPVIEVNRGNPRLIHNASYLQYSKNEDIKLFELTFKLVPELKTALKEKYKTKERDNYMHIYSNNDKVDNNFFIEVLDFIINELGDKSIINKKQ